MYVLGLSTSPRKGGNTEVLLDRVLAGAGSIGAHTEKLWIPGLHISGCRECGDCEKTGICSIKDDFQLLFRKLLEFDRLAFATPVFFMNVSAQAKAVIDRCQCFYARKYILKKPLFSQGRDIPRQGILISVAGRRTSRSFQAARVTMKYFFDVLETAYLGEVTASGIEAKGEILQHPDLLEIAYQQGIKLATEMERSVKDKKNSS